jgi:myo-inositol-1(or 4)-monophosphatase
MMEPAELAALAEEVAREAGAQLRDAFAGARPTAATKSTPTDLVSVADTRAEELIRARLTAARPADAILGEEGGDSTGTSGVQWIVDPLDGTTNFLFGLPQWAVSVAAHMGEEPLAGVVYDPLRDECWSAYRGGDARLDGVPVRGSQRADLATALVATGFGYDADVRSLQAQGLARLLPRVRDIRRFGAAALDLAWTAGGRFDAYYERGIQVWDIAAGALICERAGLAVRRLEPAPPAGSGILVAPPALIDAIQTLID